MTGSTDKQSVPTIEFVVDSRRLSGSRDNLSWGTTLYNCPAIYAWPDVAPMQPIEVPHSNGRLLIEIWNHALWRFHVYCKVRMSDPQMVVRWDSLMNASGPANGIASYDGASGEWYFATPEGIGDIDHGIITIDSQVKDHGPENGTMAIDQIRVIAVRV